MCVEDGDEMNYGVRSVIYANRKLSVDADSVQ